MKIDSIFLNFLINHKRIEPFDYDLVVDWSIEMLLKGSDSENLIKIASMSKPVERIEISNYLTETLKELNLLELPPLDKYTRRAHYHALQIKEKNNIRIHLTSLYSIYIESNDPKFEIFFSLFHAWKDLETVFIQKEMKGIQLYYKGATLENIESFTVLESDKWIENCINK